MAHSSPEGIELSKGSNLKSFNLSINKEKVLELKQQERSKSEEEVLKINQESKSYLSFGDEFDEIEWFNKFKKK